MQLKSPYARLMPVTGNELMRTGGQRARAHADRPARRPIGDLLLVPPKPPSSSPNCASRSASTPSWATPATPPRSLVRPCDCGSRVTLGFAWHGTFHHRDEATNTRPDTERYGTFDTNCRPGQPPWEGAATTGLRDAIAQYTAVWFPGAWTATAPSRAADPTMRTAPAATTCRSGVRAR